MPTLNRQLCSAEDGRAYVSVDYDSGALIANRVRYANMSPVPVLLFVYDPLGVEVLRTTLAPNTLETSLSIPVPRRWNVDDPTTRPSVNCAS